MASKPQKFEVALKRLEEIVEKMEGGELGLDESLKLFEEGVGLSQFCEKKLGEAEGKVEKLMQGLDARSAKWDAEADDDHDDDEDEGEV